MGIFARWPLFEKPEVVLERRLQENPVYPFQKESSKSSTGTGACSLVPGHHGHTMIVQIMLQHVGLTNTV